MLVDSHCHLDFPELAGEIDGVMARAERAGVGVMLTIGTHLTRFEQVLRVAERFPNVYCTVGIHPHDAGHEPCVDAKELAALAEHPKVVGFGETGLDYFYDHSPRDRQRTSFRTHIAAARQTGLPVVVHTRDADEDTMRILAEEITKGSFKGLLHCFSSGSQLADFTIENGFLISISGIVTFKKSEALRRIVETVPLDRLLVETDAPYLAPVPKRGQRNEPAFVAFTAEAVAAVKGVTAARLAEQTTANFFRLFDKARIPS